MSIFKIHLKKIKLFGYHGVLPEEKEKGQNFELNIKFLYEKTDDADRIEAAVDYAEVCTVAKQVFEAKRYDLLENLVKDIASAILDNFKAIKKVKVRASKQNPPIGADADSVSVSIKEKR